MELTPKEYRELAAKMDIVTETLRIRGIRPGNDGAENGRAAVEYAEDLETLGALSLKRAAILRELLEAGGGDE